MTSRKLVFLISEDWFFALHFLPLARAIADHGYDVSVATRVKDHGEKIRAAGLRLHPISFDRAGLNPAGAWSEFKAVSALYKTIRPSIVHHIAMKPVVIGTAAARRHNVPGIVNMIVGLGYAFSGESMRARAVRHFAEPLLRRALSAQNAQTIVQHEGDVQDLTRPNLAPLNRITTLPGVGITSQEFDVPDPPPGPPLVVLPARLLRDKGVLEFAAAARTLKREGIAARFALVGAPDATNPTSLTQIELDTIRAEGAVELWGWRDDMANVLAEASIVCLPSYYEGLPKSLLEAAAARRAIVAADIPGCRQIVLNGDAGWLAPPRDIPALETALRSAITQPALRTSYAAKAQEHARANYTLEAITSATLDLYDRLLHNANTARRN